MYLKAKPKSQHPSKANNNNISLQGNHLMEDLTEKGIPAVEYRMVIR